MEIDITQGDLNCLSVLIDARVLQHIVIFRNNWSHSPATRDIFC